VRLAPRDPRTHHGRGWAYEIRGNREPKNSEQANLYYDEALRDFDEAIKLNPDDWNILAARGQLLQRIGQPERAIRDYDEVIRRRPPDKFALMYYLERRGVAELAIGRLEEALADANDALQISPWSTEARHLRATVYLRMNRFDDAIADFESALRTGLRSAESLFGRGIVKREKGDVPGGNADIAEATRLQPDIAEVMAKRGLRP